MAIDGLMLDSPAAQLATIDWNTPWLQPWAQRGQALAQHAVRLADRGDVNFVADALNSSIETNATVPVHFTAQEGLPHGMAYEAFIHAQRQVPTRNNAHDFFNGLAWLHCPQIKTRLNQLQAAELASMGVGSKRGPVRDAITVFDENAAFLCAPEPVWEALKAKDWQTLFVQQRALWSQCRVWLFGHALLEKLMTPRKSIVAHVYAYELPRVALDANDWRPIDEWISGDLTPSKLATKPFYPLPVLGIPRWCSENDLADFYNDVSVFRLPR